MTKLFKYLAASLVAMLCGFFIGLLFIPESIVAMANGIVSVALIVLLILALFTKRKRKHGVPRFSMNWVYVFAFLHGVLLYPTLMYYLSALGVILFFNIILSSILIFAIMAAIGAKQKSGSFIGLGKVLFVALLVLIIMSIVNLFLQIGWLPILLSAAGVIIFTLYIMYDMNQFKTAYEAGYIKDRNDYSYFVYMLFIDWLNLVIDLMDLVNRIKN